MIEFPLPLTELLGQWGSYIVYLVIGLFFGFILENAGFGNSKKLAAQFYFTDLSVFKVMFSAIIVAMTLIFLSAAIGLLDYNLIWVPPTYLWPGIVGGLVMGVGFIIGGFCPGTSLVAVATAKIDGFFFVAGVLLGILLFGETVSYFDIFFNSSDYGRFTLPELFGSSYGVVVFSIVVAALMMFVGAEYIEKATNDGFLFKMPTWSMPALAALVILAATTLFMGQPDNQDRWQRIEAEAQTKLDDRSVQISAAELLDLMHDTKLKPILLDVRDESDFNQFHIQGSTLLPMEKLLIESKTMQYELANTVFVLISNDEKRATKAWKMLRAESVPNLYLLEGGINNWLEMFAEKDFLQNNLLAERDEDCLAFRFDAALGDRIAAAEPEYSKNDPFLQFTPKIKLELKRAPTSGGCG